MAWNNLSRLYLGSNTVRFLPAAAMASCAEHSHSCTCRSAHNLAAVQALHDGLGSSCLTVLKVLSQAYLCPFGSTASTAVYRCSWRHRHTLRHGKRINETLYFIIAEKIGHCRSGGLKMGPDSIALQRSQFWGRLPAVVLLQHKRQQGNEGPFIMSMNSFKCKLKTIHAFPAIEDTCKVHPQHKSCSCLSALSRFALRSYIDHSV
jgi:hypothetical protein